MLHRIQLFIQCIIMRQVDQQLLLIQITKMIKPNLKNNDFLQMQSYFLQKDKLQKQNAMLMKERSIIAQHTSPSIEDQRLKTNFYIQNHTTLQHQQSDNLVTTLKKKVQEVIDLCQCYTLNNKSAGQVQQVVQAQKQILNLLNRKTQPKIPQQNKQKNKPSSMKNTSDQTKQLPNKTSISQEHHRLQDLRQYIGDQAMQMIEEIQRKALLQIESLRLDKINLLKKLNDEVKAHNQQKQKRIMLQKNQTREPTENVTSIRKNRNIQNNIQQVVMNENNQNQYQYNEFSNNTFAQRRQPQQQYQQLPPRRYSNIYPPREIQQNQLNLVNPQNIRLPSPMTKSYQQQVEMYSNDNQRYQPSISHDPHIDIRKNELRSQVNNLSTKIQQYQEILDQQKRKGQSFDMKQLNNLISQSNQISQQGNRLANNRKISCKSMLIIENRTAVSSYHPQQPNTYQSKSIYNQNVQKRSSSSEKRNLLQSRPALLTFCPSDRYKHNRSQVSGFEAERYEQVIAKMEDAMRN